MLVRLERSGCLGFCPSYVLTVYGDGQRQRTITHYQGCLTHPDLERITALEDAIDRISRSERWVGTKKDRDAVFGAPSCQDHYRADERCAAGAPSQTMYAESAGLPRAKPLL